MSLSVRRFVFLFASAGLFGLTGFGYAQAPAPEADEQLLQLSQLQQQGKAIAYDRNKGNCLSCHSMDDGELPGNSGPPLLMMKVRFPDRQVLRQQIWDASEANPDSIMPPYGRHHILNDHELDLVVDYIYTL